jgi:hypothetical protein
MAVLELRRIRPPSLAAFSQRWLWARLGVLAVIAGAVPALVLLRWRSRVAAEEAEVNSRPAGLLPAPWVRTTVLVVILVLLVVLLGAGHPLVISVMVVLAVPLTSADNALRVSGLMDWLPGQAA